MWFLGILFSACIDTKIDTPDSVLYDTDIDNDGFGADDCDDENALVSPTAEEICDGLDNNCDGNIDEGLLSFFYRDADGDGFGDEHSSTESCEQPEGYTLEPGDCDDSDDTVYPAAQELCNERDDDCDGAVDNGLNVETYYADNDGDEYGDLNQALSTCLQPNNMVLDHSDCDDSNSTVHPNAIEICNGIDDNCDSIIDDDAIDLLAFYEDTDGDGYGAGGPVLSCSPQSGFTDVDGDCDDANGEIYPNAQEFCNGIDDDCDGLLDSSAVCPCNLEEYNGHSYLFCQDVATWHTAKSSCEVQENYHLVVLDDDAEQSWVWDRTVHYAVEYWWWLGYHNQNASSSQEPTGGWEWVDGSNNGYTNWYSANPQQPDNYGGNEDCAHIDPSHGAWNDLECTSSNWGGAQLYYICESGE